MKRSENVNKQNIVARDYDIMSSSLFWLLTIDEIGLLVLQTYILFPESKSPYYAEYQFKLNQLNTTYFSCCSKCLMIYCFH
jgi:hypothetical protein